MTITDITTTRAEQISAEKPGVTVYSKPNCVQCTATMRALDKAEITYDVVDMTVEPDTLTWAKSLGHMAAPVVAVGSPTGGEITWAGFQPDLIKKHITERAA